MVNTIDISKATQVEWNPPSITGLDGGTSSDLDSIGGSEIPDGKVVKFFLSGEYVVYKHVNGTETQALPGIVTVDSDPTNYYWIRVS